MTQTKKNVVSFLLGLLLAGFINLLIHPTIASPIVFFYGMLDPIGVLIGFLVVRLLFVAVPTTKP